MPTTHRSLSKAAPAHRDWVQTFGIVGYATKGVVYAVIGVLAARTAFGAGGRTTDAKGALTEIGSQPFGQILLVLSALGLLGYAIWRFVQAWTGPGRLGADAESSLKRAGWVVSGLVHLSLAWFAASLAFGSSSGQGRGAAGWTAELMAKPFGQWLVGLVGVIVATVGAREFLRAYRLSFMKDYGRHPMSAQQRRVARAAGRIGLSARGVVFLMIGVFVVAAAVQADPNEARGLGGALRALLEQDYGAVLLGVVAIGLVAYAVHCFFNARYRRFVP